MKNIVNVIIIKKKTIYLIFYLEYTCLIVIKK